jgi:hypothetical protein
MRYTLFVTDSSSSKQLYSSEDLGSLKSDADLRQKLAKEEDDQTDILYIVKQAYHVVYKAKA